MRAYYPVTVALKCVKGEYLYEMHWRQYSSKRDQTLRTGAVETTSWSREHSETLRTAVGCMHTEPSERTQVTHGGVRAVHTSRFPSLPVMDW